MSKCRLVKGFGQNVSKLSMGINVEQIDVVFLIMTTKKVKANINVLGLRMQHMIHGNTYGIHAIAKQRHMMKIQAKIS
jgi:Lhr-like helicase